MAASEWVFISYETVLGLNLARLAKMRLELVGLSGWVWQDDSCIGEYTYEEIANRVFEFAHFLYICTPTSHECAGQIDERGYAKAAGHQAVVIAFDKKDISPILSNVRQERTTNIGFQDSCDLAAKIFLERNSVPAATDEPATSEMLPRTTVSG